MFYNSERDFQNDIKHYFKLKTFNSKIKKWQKMRKNQVFLAAREIMVKKIIFLSFIYIYSEEEEHL